MSLGGDISVWFVESKQILHVMNLDHDEYIVNTRRRNKFVRFNGPKRVLIRVTSLHRDSFHP